MPEVDSTPEDIQQVVSWHRIWGVVAKSGDISNELDRHVAMMVATLGMGTDPKKIRKQTVSKINSAISRGEVTDNLARCATTIDSTIRQSMTEKAN